MLVLPDVAQLVRDEIVGYILELPFEEDQRPDLIAPESAQPRDAEQPGRVQDPYVPHPDRLGVEVEPGQTAGGPGEVRPLELVHGS